MTDSLKDRLLNGRLNRLVDRQIDRKKIQVDRQMDILINMQKKERKVDYWKIGIIERNTDKQKLILLYKLKIWLLNVQIVM